MRLTLSDENKPLFVTLQKIHKHPKYNDENISKLYHYKLINTDGTLTLRGKKFLYSFRFGIPVRAFEILVIYYHHRKLQTHMVCIPMCSNLTQKFFNNMKDSALRKNIRFLLDGNYIRRISSNYFIITDSAYEIMTSNSQDIGDIETDLNLY